MKPAAFIQLGDSVFEHLTDAQRAEIRAIVREEIEATFAARDELAAKHVVAGLENAVERSKKWAAADVTIEYANRADPSEAARVLNRVQRRKVLAAQTSRVTDWPAKKADDQPVRDAIAEMLDWLGTNVLGVSGLGKLYAEDWEASPFDPAEYANGFWKRLQLRVGNDGLPGEGDDLVLEATDEQHQAVQQRGADEGGGSPGVDHVGHVVTQSGGDVGASGQLQVSESGERTGLGHESSPSVGCGNATVGEPTGAGEQSPRSPAPDRGQ